MTGLRRPPSGAGRTVGCTGALLVATLLGDACPGETRPGVGPLQLAPRARSFRMPVRRGELPFRYPRAAWRRGAGGEVRLRIHIDEHGVVDTAYVLRSSGDASLDSAALAGARRLRYRPAVRGDDPVGVWAVLPVRYPSRSHPPAREEP